MILKEEFCNSVVRLVMYDGCCSLLVMSNNDIILGLGIRLLQTR